MQRKLLQLLLIMLMIVLAGVFMIKLKNKDSEAMKSEDKITVVTTIYPIYLIGLNLTDQMNNLQIESLINRNTGCLHDYQLTADDMKVISTADVLIINGGGMEAFLEDITVNYPALKIIDASQGLDMLSSMDFEASESSYSKQHQEATEDEEAYNSHVWLDPLLYEKQIDNVRAGLIDYIHTAFIDKVAEADDMIGKLSENARAYTDKVNEVELELEKCKDELAAASGNVDQVVIFHEAFAYLANRLNIPVAFSVELEADTSLSAGNIAKIVTEVEAGNIKYLFTEEQYSEAIPKQIAKETGTKVNVIDSVVTGDGSRDSYLKAMRSNIEVIKQAEK